MYTTNKYAYIYLLLLFLVLPFRLLTSQDLHELNIIKNKGKTLKLTKTKEQAQAYYDLGKSFYQEGYYKKTEPQLLNALELFTSAKDTLGIAESLLLLGKNAYELYFYYDRNTNSFSKADYYANQSLALAKSINHNRLIGDALLFSARLIARKDGHIQGNKAFQECLAFFLKHNLEKKELYYYLAENYYWQDNCQDKAIPLLKEGLALDGADELNGKLLVLLARYSIDLGSSDSASIYFNKAIEHYEKIPSTIGRYNAYYYYAYFLLFSMHNKKEKEKGKLYFQKAIDGYESFLDDQAFHVKVVKADFARKIGDKETSLTYHEEIQELLNNSYKNILLVDKRRQEYKYANALYQAGRYKEAKQAYINVWQMAKMGEIQWLECDMAYYLAHVEYQLGNYKEAIELGKKSIEISQAIAFPDGITGIYSLLDSVSIKLKDYEAAYQYKSLQIRIQDPEFTAFQQQELALEYEAKLNENLNNNRQIQLQKEEAELLAQAQQKRIYGLIALLLLIAIFTYLHNERTKKQTQVSVRQQITKDIHDNVGGVLNDLNRMAKAALTIPKNNDQNTSLERVVQLSNQATTTLRKVISSNKNNGQAVSLKVIETILRDLTIKKMLYNHQAYQLDIQGFQEKGKLPHRIHHNFLMIYKEVLNNATKYGTTRPININIAYTYKKVFLTVTNSIDKETTKKLSSTKMGLNNIRERAKFLKGTVDFTIKNGSFTVRFSCPNQAITFSKFVPLF